MIFKSILDTVGQTPLIEIKNKCTSNCNIQLYGKIEGYNPSGSVKDRAASNILKYLLSKRIIDQNSTIIESSSGNFGIALASYCQQLNLKFICVVDPKIQNVNEEILLGLGAHVIKVTEKDAAGGYLKNRIKKVQELNNKIENSIWINQYSNKRNAAGYISLGHEIVREIKPDYIFLGVSSGSTIYGMSRYIKMHSPTTKIIAVDVKGSVIFGQSPQERVIAGIGSGVVSDLIRATKINDYVIVSETESASMCRYLLKENALFLGGSSGAVFSGIINYFGCNTPIKSPCVVAIFADRGDRYVDTVYNSRWCLNNLDNYQE